MNRREFVRSSCLTCLAVSGTTLFFASCRATRYIRGTLDNNGLTVDVKEFIATRKGKTVYRPYVIVRNDALKYPICIYRLGMQEYVALWMQCTHQGTELQVSGDRLHCPAHGSEFNSSGVVKTGPADKSLRTFPVTVSTNQLFIDLREL